MHKLHAIFAHLRPNCGGSLTAGVAALLTTFKDFSSLDKKRRFSSKKKLLNGNLDYYLGAGLGAGTGRGPSTASMSSKVGSSVSKL